MERFKIPLRDYVIGIKGLVKDGKYDQLTDMFDRFLISDDCVVPVLGGESENPIVLVAESVKGLSQVVLLMAETLRALSKIVLEAESRINEIECRMGDLEVATMIELGPESELSH